MLTQTPVIIPAAHNLRRSISCEGTKPRSVCRQYASMAPYSSALASMSVHQKRVIMVSYNGKKKRNMHILVYPFMNNLNIRDDGTQLMETPSLPLSRLALLLRVNKDLSEETAERLDLPSTLFLLRLLRPQNWGCSDRVRCLYAWSRVKTLESSW
jgi:hypothetical protein